MSHIAEKQMASCCGPTSWRTEGKLGLSTHGSSAKSSDVVNNLYNLLWQPWRVVGPVLACGTISAAIKLPFWWIRRTIHKEINKIISDNSKCWEENSFVIAPCEHEAAATLDSRKRGLTEEGTLELRSA